MGRKDKNYAKSTVDVLGVIDMGPKEYRTLSWLYGPVDKKYLL